MVPEIYHGRIWRYFWLFFYCFHRFCSPEMGKVLVQDNRQKKISGISFGVFSDQQLKQLSVLELHERNIYDISGPQRVPAKFGVLDNRLGPTGKGSLCGTCGEPHQKCVGHFGLFPFSLALPCPRPHRRRSSDPARLSCRLLQAHDYRPPKYLQDLFPCPAGGDCLSSVPCSNPKPKH